MRTTRSVLVLLVATAIALLGALTLPQSVGTAEAQEEFTCTVVDDVLSWTDQGVDRYQIRQIVGDNDTYVGAVEGATSLALTGNADTYVVKYRVNLNVTETSCAGNPAPPFTCSVADDVLSWSDQGLDRYQIRQVIAGDESFLTSVEGATSLALVGNADSYVIRARINGVLEETSCAGNPAPEFTCSVVDGVLSWTDQGQPNYNVRQIIGDAQSYLGATAELSFPVSGFADTYVVRTRINGVVTDTSCAGEPLPEFTCEVINPVVGVFILTWTDQQQDRYQFRHVIAGVESFVTTVEGATEIQLAVPANEYVVRYRTNGVITETRCDGVPLPL